MLLFFLLTLWLSDLLRSLLCYELCTSTFSIAGSADSALIVIEKMSRCIGEKTVNRLGYSLARIASSRSFHALANERVIETIFKINVSRNINLLLSIAINSLKSCS